MSTDEKKQKNIIIFIIISMVQGALIGSGAIIPGVSGGVLAVIFGIYEPLIKFLSDIRVDFKKNFLRFLPVGIGGIAGFVLLSGLVSYMFKTSQVQIIWFFIGAIAGTFPSLYKHSGKEGRQTKHIIIFVATIFLSYALLQFIEKSSAEVTPNFFLWIVAGMLVVLGAILPGLSPSNILITMNMYEPMTDGIKSLNISIIIPLAIGGIVCILAFSKLVNYLIEKHYSIVFHIILGVVVASTVKIVPIDSALYSGQWTVPICIFTLIAGIALGYWMSILEKKYKND